MAVKPPAFDYAQAVFSPSHRVTLAVKAVERMAGGAERGIRLGLGSDFDSYFLPLKPGDLCTVVGLSQHGKSALMQFAAQQAAKQLSESSRDREIVLLTTWEQTVEEATILDLARLSGYTTSHFAHGTAGDVDRVSKAAVQATIPGVWMIG